MTVQIIISKDFKENAANEMSDYLDDSVLQYLTARGWIIDNISTI